MTEINDNPWLRVDAHVHMHACFDPDRFLDSAADNLRAAPTKARLVSGILCLTETADARWFESISTKIGSADNTIARNRWIFQATEEENSVLAVDSQGRQLAIISGRQIVTCEGLEVLALGHNGVLEDGQATASILETVAASGAIPVLPWGFGKWSGKRGTLVNRLINDPPCDFLLGDNGGRLAIAPVPSGLKSGRAKGFEILPGSDPFPFPWDEGRVGSFGFELHARVPANTPFETLRSLVFDPNQARRSYGRLERLPGFVRNQIAIQIRKRTNKWT